MSKAETEKQSHPTSQAKEESHEERIERKLDEILSILRIRLRADLE